MNRERLQNLKEKAWEKMQDALKTRDARLASFYTTLINRIEQDELTLAAIEERARTYEKSLNNGEPSDSPSSSLLLDVLKAVPSPRSVQNIGRKMGREAREAFVSEARNLGCQLKQLEISLYETTTGKKVGIAFANEQRPSRWFLGVQDNKYDVIVLLCRQSSGERVEFILPRELLGKLWNLLSRNGGQVKFNVIKSGVNWSLLVPGHASESLNSFLSIYTPLNN